MANTLFVGKVYQRFDELSSTNDYARDLLAKSKPPEGTVIRAAIQSAGRGQYGSNWVSEPGKNLTLSVLFYPSWISAQAQFQLSAAIALAVRDTVSTALATAGVRPSVKIKWPNDIYLGSRKTAGILIQNTLQRNTLQASVVGIGLNVNQTHFPETTPNATSLALAAGRQYPLEELADSLFECLERRYLQLKGGHVQTLWEEYHRNLLGRGEMRNFIRTGNGPFSGIIQGVRDDGCLVIKNGSREETFDVKEVRMA